MKNYLKIVNFYKTINITIDISNNAIVINMSKCRREYERIKQEI